MGHGQEHPIPLDLGQLPISDELDFRTAYSESVNSLCSYSLY